MLDSEMLAMNLSDYFSFLLHHIFSTVQSFDLRKSFVQRDAFMHLCYGVLTILDLLHLPDRLRPGTGWRKNIGYGCKMCKIAVS